MVGHTNDSKSKIVEDIIRNREIVDGCDRAKVFMLMEHILTTIKNPQRVAVNYFSIGTLLNNLFTWNELQVYRGHFMDE